MEAAGGDVVMLVLDGDGDGASLDGEVGDDRWAGLLAGKIMEVVLLSIFFNFKI